MTNTVTEDEPIELSEGSIEDLNDLDQINALFEENLPKEDT